MTFSLADVERTTLMARALPTTVVKRQRSTELMNFWTHAIGAVLLLVFGLTRAATYAQGGAGPGPGGATNALARARDAHLGAMGSTVVLLVASASFHRLRANVCLVAVLRVADISLLFISCALNEVGDLMVIGASLCRPLPWRALLDAPAMAVVSVAVYVAVRSTTPLSSTWRMWGHDHSRGRDTRRSGHADGWFGSIRVLLLATGTLQWICTAPFVVHSLPHGLGEAMLATKVAGVALFLLFGANDATEATDQWLSGMAPSSCIRKIPQAHVLWHLGTLAIGYARTLVRDVALTSLARGPTPACLAEGLLAVL